MNTKSLYVHIPFCDHICGYCDFNRFLYNRNASDKFLIKLLMDINALEGKFQTIYVGGGTPTSLMDDQLESLLEALSLKLDTNYEWTFEANPENITIEKAMLLKKYGVNRMSLGVQSSDPQILMDIGRHHTFYDVENAVKLIRQVGINNISLDLIYGLPGQSVENYQYSLEDVLSLEPDHISVYALILEPNSLFGKENIKTVSIDVETQMYIQSIETLQKYGYEHYEISNFARNKRYSNHNLAYWHYDNYEAIGPGASKKIDDTRKTVSRSMVKYLREDAYDEILVLDIEDQMFEFIMMGLRLKEGITFDRFYKYFEVDLTIKFKDAISKAVSEKLLIVEEDRIKASDEGFIMLDNILLHFMD